MLVGRGLRVIFFHQSAQRCSYTEHNDSLWCGSTEVSQINTMICRDGLIGWMTDSPSDQTNTSCP